MNEYERLVCHPDAAPDSDAVGGVFWHALMLPSPRAPAPASGTSQSPHDARDSREGDEQVLWKAFLPSSPLVHPGHGLEAPPANNWRRLLASNRRDPAEGKSRDDTQQTVYKCSCVGVDSRAVMMSSDHVSPPPQSARLRPSSEDSKSPTPPDQVQQCILVVEDEFGVC